MLDGMVRVWWRLVRFGFWLLYNELAFTYDVVSQVVSMGQWRCWQRTVFRHMPLVGSTPVLELAHGTGDLQLDLHERGYGAVGLDLSAYMGRLTDRKLQNKGVRGQLVRGKGQRLPFADDSFPAVVCTFPTPFILAEDTLTELWRVLQPAGKLIVVMSGLLTGDSLPETVIEGLYAATGQRNGVSEGIMERFAQVGFEAQMVQEPCTGSVVILIIAEKKG